jgi:peptidylprolyl isomerase
MIAAALGCSRREATPFLLTEVQTDRLGVDLNHPLAGQALTFEVEVVGISDTPTQQPAGCGGNCSSGCQC